MKRRKGPQLLTAELERARPWVKFEINMLVDYEIYWQQRTKATWLLKFNGWLCMSLIAWYGKHLPYRPPTFRPWYVRLTHRYYRWRKI